MALRSAIEWTHVTWNPVTGCTKVSLGCQNCYAERIALRLKATGSPKYRNGFKLTLHPSVLEEPLSWRKPRMVFVGSMGDLFHDRVTLDFIRGVFEVIEKTARHQFQILTKRSERLLELSTSLSWPPNLWMGVTVETQDYLSRIEHLRNTAAKIKFLSLEPLLGPLSDLDLAGMDWIIVGGESGPKARPMALEWVRSLRAQCLRANVPFFFKQWGGVFRKRQGRLLDGRTWDGMPKIAPSVAESARLF